MRVVRFFCALLLLGAVVCLAPGVKALGPLDDAGSQVCKAWAGGLIAGDDSSLPIQQLLPCNNNLSDCPSVVNADVNTAKEKVPI
jgi:hypothetical protein